MLLRSGCAVRSTGSGGCPPGCPPLGPVPWSRVLCGCLSLGVCRVPWGGLAWSPRLCRVLSHPVPVPPCRHPTLVSRPFPLSPPVSVPLRLCGAPCSGRWLGSLPGGLGAVVGCAVLSVVPCVGVPPSPCAGTCGRWARPGVVRACQVWAAVARLGGRAPLGWSALCLGVAVSLGGLPVSTGCRGRGDAGPSGLAPPSFVVRVLVPVVVSSPPVPWPLPFPFPSVGGPPVVRCPRVVFLPVPYRCKRVPVTLGLSLSPCRRPSLCPFPFRCAGGGVVARSVESLWPMPGVGCSGATGGGLWGCRGGRGHGPRSGRRFPMSSAAWGPQGRGRWGGQGCG